MVHHFNVATALLTLFGVSQAAPGAIPDAKPVPIGLALTSTVEGPAPEIVSFKPSDIQARTLSNLTESFNPDPTTIAARSVIGPDNRNTIANTRDWPYRPVGKIFGNGYYCSGSLVGPRHVLTARHCVGNGAIRFVPGYNAGEEPFGSSTAYVVGTVDYTTPGECTQEWDFAIVVLNDRLGDKTGHFGVKVFDAATQMNQPMFANTGYPSDRDGGTRMTNQAFIPARRNRECGTAMLVGTTADVAGGQSGGPLWAWGQGDAVEVYGALSAGSSYESTFGGGREMLSLLAEMRKQHP